MYKLLILSVLIGLGQVAWGQTKRSLTHEDYDLWESVSSTDLSRKGSWVAVQVQPQEGDGYLQIAEHLGDAQWKIARAGDALFTASEGYLVFGIAPQYDSVRMLKLADTKDDDMPNDSMGILNLNNGEQTRIANISSFSVPAKGGDWVVYTYEEGYPEVEVDSTEDEPEELPGKTLVVRYLPTGDEYSLDRVKSSTWGEEGKWLAIVREAIADSVDNAGVFVFDTGNRSFMAIDTGLVTYADLTWDDSGDQLAYMATADSTDADLRHFSVFHWTSKDGLKKVLTTESAGIPENWWVSENGSLRFSENGKRLFVGTAPMPVKYAYEEDTTLLDDERPGLDIWNWQDKTLMPRQLLQKNRDANRTYRGVYWLESGTFVQLEDDLTEDFTPDDDWNADVFVGIDNTPYELSYSWEGHWRSDIYAIDVKTGAKTLIYEGATFSGDVSPGGDFIYWYQVDDSAWMAYDIAEKQLRNISKKVPYPVFDEDDDHPMLPYQYGSGGWVEGDEAFLIYDKYDIWSLDPTGDADPVCVTDGKGRADEIEYRMYRLDWNDKTTLPKRENQIVSGFNLNTMGSGMYMLNLRRKTVEPLLFGDRIYSSLEKAPESKNILFTQQTFRESPNVYMANWDMTEVMQITNLNPQQEEVLWGSVELVHYNSLNGVPLNGLLYKPENFDPNKKYPMIVYFYEQSSRGLHRYRSARPSASTINFPWALSNGYLVFVPDIIYQEGRPGPSAYDCIVPGTMAMIDRGFVDENAIGLQGQSWGGYQTAYLVTQTNLYKCASAGAIVSNMTSAYGGIRWGSGLSRMFQYERTQSRLGGTLWDRRDVYIENSPLFYVPQIETPLLLMHNDEDSAVPWYQGIEMFVAMRRLSKPCWMLVYNGEPHNLRQRRNQMDLSMRMGQFFDHYLKGEPMPLWMSDGLPAVDKGRYLGYELEKEDELLNEEE